VRADSFADFFSELNSGELVIKPVVGANGAEIRLVATESKLLLRGQQALDPLATVPLYARADFVRDGQQDFLVMELELIEPSMYLRTDSGAPMRFAQAIDQRFRINVR